MRAIGLMPLVVILFASSCSQLPGLTGPGGPRPKPPDVKVTSVELVDAPSAQSLAMYFCPKLANSFVCSALGSAPSAEDLDFVFDVMLQVGNQNTTPLPAVEAMVAFTAYPEATHQANVGAVCVALCAEGEVCGAPPADGCRARGDTLKTLDDYAGAALSFVTRAATGQVDPRQVRVRTIPAGGNVAVSVRLAVNPDAMLALIENVATDTLGEITRGKVPTLVIPFEIEGTMWAEVEQFGKIGAGFGPFADSWQIH